MWSHCLRLPNERMHNNMGQSCWRLIIFTSKTTVSNSCQERANRQKPLTSKAHNSATYSNSQDKHVHQEIRQGGALTAKSIHLRSSKFSTELPTSPLDWLKGEGSLTQKYSKWKIWSKVIGKQVETSAVMCNPLNYAFVKRILRHYFNRTNK